MTNVKKVAGFDVSKDCFDLHLSDDCQPLARRFEYTARGMADLKDALDPQVHCVMEATGPYHLRLAFYLHAQGYRVSVVNPLVIKRFSQMLLLRTKTDRADARMIAEYGSSQQPPLWTPPERYSIALGQLQTFADQLQKHHTATSCQLHSFAITGMMEKETKKLLESQIAYCERQMERVEARIGQIITEHHDQMLSAVASIPGIGKKTATALIVLSGGFTRFSNYRQLSAYIGMCPRIYESGKSVKGKARICKMGMGRIRALLYVCSWSASRCNQACRDLYERLTAKGKPKKLALIAVANKLIKQAFAIATTNSTYQLDYTKKTCL